MFLTIWQLPSYKKNDGIFWYTMTYNSYPDMVLKTNGTILKNESSIQYCSIQFISRYGIRNEFNIRDISQASTNVEINCKIC